MDWRRARIRMAVMRGSKRALNCRDFERINTDGGLNGSENAGGVAGRGPKSREGLEASRQDLTELMTWLKAHPNASFGSVGMGGPGRVWGTYFANTIGAAFQFIPYRGAAAFMQDLIAGQIKLPISSSE